MPPSAAAAAAATAAAVDVAAAAVADNTRERLRITEKRYGQARWQCHSDDVTTRRRGASSPPRGARVLRACEIVHALDRTQQKV